MFLSTPRWCCPITLHLGLPDADIQQPTGGCIRSSTSSILLTQSYHLRHHSPLLTAIFSRAIANADEAIVNEWYDMECACRRLERSNAHACSTKITAHCRRTWSCQSLAKRSETAREFHTPEFSETTDASSVPPSSRRSRCLGIPCPRHSLPSLPTEDQQIHNAAQKYEMRRLKDLEHACRCLREM